MASTPHREENQARRICQKTGLALTAGPATALRIAKQSYGPLNPLPREVGSDHGEWGRNDTIGRTLYACADPVTAYMELLSPYRTKIDEERRALQPLADFLEIPLENLWEQVVSEWDEAGTMKADWLPRVFREGRELYTLRFPTGWWIDFTATETLAAIQTIFSDSWPVEDGRLTEPLTLAHLTGDDRVLTTSIAAAVRDSVELDDGTLPLGIQYISKHGRPSGGDGWCWAYWMRDVDAGLKSPPRWSSARRSMPMPRRSSPRSDTARSSPASPTQGFSHDDPRRPRVWPSTYGQQ
jgi:hypothetical protein